MNCERSLEHVIVNFFLKSGTLFNLVYLFDNNLLYFLNSLKICDTRSYMNRNENT